MQLPESSKNLLDMINALDEADIDYVCECNADTYFITCQNITFHFDEDDKLMGIGFLKPDVTKYTYVSLLNN